MRHPNQHIVLPKRPGDEITRRFLRERVNGRNTTVIEIFDCETLVTLRRTRIHQHLSPDQAEAMAQEWADDIRYDTGHRCSFQVTYPDRDTAWQ